MKSKRRHQDSSEDTEESDASDVSSSSSSASESDNSSVSEHRHKKKKKRAGSLTDSDSLDHKRSKKRKNKKKKRKHSKKKHRLESDNSDSGDDSSPSEGEILSKKKKKHKHKHSKRARTHTDSDHDNEHAERRLHSVVRERRGSSDEHAPSRTYYGHQDYRHSPPDVYEREKEVERLYRGSSKERRYHESQAYEKHIRHQRYEERRTDDDYPRRPREDVYTSREAHRGYNKHDQYEDRGGRRREYEEAREYRQRRGPPEPPERYREREYIERPVRPREEREPFSDERPRDVRRERPALPGRPEKPPVSRPRERSSSLNRDDRYKERSRRPERERSVEHRDRFDQSREDRPEKMEPKPRERKSRFTDTDTKDYSWGKQDPKKEGNNTQGDKEKPNFGLTGKLTADANTVNGVVIKYTEPDDAKQPKRRWRFYPFKGDKALPILYIHRQSAFLIGRDKKVVDIALEHPSISKQHAALQYRATPFTRPDGSQGRRVRPYIIDLDSANGTFVNNKKIEARRYVELLERDVVKFGFSQREYVLLHENSKDDAQDDDHHDPPDIGAEVTTTEQLKQEKRVKLEVAEDGE